MVILLVFCSTFSYSQTTKATSDSCYNMGNIAYKNKNYIDALEFLYAYKMLNLKNFDLNKTYSSILIDSVIKDCEYRLKELAKQNIKLKNDLSKCQSGLDRYIDNEVSREKTNDK